MANIDRFIQDLDNMVEPSKDLTALANITEKRVFLDKGTQVILTNPNIGEVTITDRLSRYKDKLYDYEGEYQNEEGSTSKVYFDEISIQEVKKKEVKLK